MISILVVSMVLISSSHGEGCIECSFMLDPPQTKCSGASGQLLLFYLPTSDIRLKKDAGTIGTILKLSKNGNATLYTEYANEAKFSNGTLMLGPARTSHSGIYTLEWAGTNATSKKEEMQVLIRAVVSKVDLSEWCLSVETRIATCSADGDQLNFNLTLNGDPLQVTPGRPGSQSVMLSGQSTGELVCIVWNDFSQQEKMLWVTEACQQFSGTTVVVAAMAAGIIFVLLVAACLHKRNAQLKTTAADSVARSGAVSEVGAAAARAAGEAHTQISYATSMLQSKGDNPDDVVYSLVQFKPSNSSIKSQ